MFPGIRKEVIRSPVIYRYFLMLAVGFPWSVTRSRDLRRGLLSLIMQQSSRDISTDSAGIPVNFPQEFP